MRLTTALLRISLLIAFCLVNSSKQSVHDNVISDEDDHSGNILDIASSFIQQSLSQEGGNSGAGLAAVGGLISTLMQSGGSSGGADLLSGIGTIINSVGNSKSGFDPSIITNVLSLFNTDSSSNNKDHTDGDNHVNIESILSLASGLLSGVGNSETKKIGGPKKSQNNGDAMSNIVGALPMLLSTLKSFTGDEAKARSEKHSGHAWFLPPVVEQMHVMFDHFINSELGHALWKKSGLQNIVQSFLDQNNDMDYTKMLQKLENHSFRRRWISMSTKYLVGWINHIAKLDVQKKYLNTAQMVVNGFLKSQGYHTSALFDSTRPAESLTNMVNTVIKRQFDVKVDSGVYIKPALDYANELLAMSQSRGFFQRLNSSDLTDHVTDILNLEIIEPVLKVYRAYRYAINNPQCDKYVMCELNTHDPNEKHGLPGFKVTLTKVSSVLANWFISTQTGTSFWTLYNAAIEAANCQIRYPVDCSDFHIGEAHVTTEYIHNEL